MRFTFVTAVATILTLIDGDDVLQMALHQLNLLTRGHFGFLMYPIRTVRVRLSGSESSKLTGLFRLTPWNDTKCFSY